MATIQAQLEREIDGNLEAKYFPPMTFNDYSKRIDEAKQQVKLGQVISLEDFEKEMEITDSIMTPEELRNELLEGIKDSKKGLFISVEDLIIESKNW
jgi:PHD/YefM family antitoxin component YafN of YafNO toxin-antitoxin module